MIEQARQLDEASQVIAVQDGVAGRWAVPRWRRAQPRGQTQEAYAEAVRPTNPIFSQVPA